MLEQLVLAGGGTAALTAGARLVRARPFRPHLGAADRWWVTADRRSAPDNPGDYLPDTRELARQIVMGMHRLGHALIAQPVRALAPYLHITGAEADINSLIDFEPTILADIQAFVKANGQRHRWTLKGRPCFTYSAVPDATPGLLRFSRVRPPRGALPPDAIQAGRPGEAADGLDENADAMEYAAHNGGWRCTRALAARRHSDSNMKTHVNGLSLPPTRLVSRRWDGTPTATGSGSARLFRLGGGNVYHLAPGANLAGRDPDRCDIILGFDDAVSAVHAEITVHDDGDVTVRDLRSSNGTAIDGRPVTGGAAVVNHGSVLTIGTTQLRLINGNSHLVPMARTSARW